AGRRGASGGLLVGRVRGRDDRAVPAGGRGPVAVRVLVVAEQLRRAVPGGIGTYVRGLLQGLRQLEDGAEATLWASRGPRRGSDPLAAEGPLAISRLPGPLLTRAWDHGRAGCPPGFDVLHATSLAVPPGRGTPASVMVHD